MLNIESFNRESIINHSFKQRDIKVILFSKVIDCRVRLQLLVVSWQLVCIHNQHVLFELYRLILCDFYSKLVNKKWITLLIQL